MQNSCGGEEVGWSEGHWWEAAGSGGQACVQVTKGLGVQGCWTRGRGDVWEAGPGLARGRREDETGQKTNLQSVRTAPREVKRARAARRPRERGAGRCGGQPVLGTRRPAWGGHEA